MGDGILVFAHGDVCLGLLVKSCLAIYPFEIVQFKLLFLQFKLEFIDFLAKLIIMQLKLALSIFSFTLIRKKVLHKFMLILECLLKHFVMHLHLLG